MLSIASREKDGVTILDLNGRITLGEGSVMFRNAIQNVLGQEKKNVLLNLGEVNYLDQSGLGELISAFTVTHKQGAELKLLNLTQKIKDVLHLTKLYTVFDVYDDEAVGVASFNKRGDAGNRLVQAGTPKGVAPTVAN